MEPTFILLNGLPGSGKSTIGRWLAERLGACVVFDVDDLTRVFPFEFSDRVLTFGVDNMALLAQNAQIIGVEYVVTCGGLWRQDLLERFVARVPAGRCLYVWLDVSAPTRLARKLERARDDADSASEFKQIDAKFGDHGSHILFEGRTIRLKAEGRTLEAVGNELVSLVGRQ
jgi:gluconate kinase